jgi:actin
MFFSVRLERVLITLYCSLSGAALQRRELLDLKSPMSHGVITNWDDMEKLWHHLFYNELSAAPDEHAVLLSEAPMTPKTSRERTVQTMFETFNVPGCFLSPDACLALAASGRTAGLVLDVGEGTANSVPIYEGFALHTAIARADLAGHDLTQFLAASFPPDFSSQVVCGIKEKLCYVALDPEQEAEAGSPTQDYMLPDGQTVSVGNERYTHPRTPHAAPLTIHTLQVQGSGGSLQSISC